mmetsp:Transcript_41531/g.87121  ORF Transcript_41531/g.87121 Transcript_41531/m.87121 type:complete len:209 (+) Transcript_41531:917-1543(+)
MAVALALSRGIKYRSFRKFTRSTQVLPSSHSHSAQKSFFFSAQCSICSASFAFFLFSCLALFSISSSDFLQDSFFIADIIAVCLGVSYVLCNAFTRLAHVICWLLDHRHMWQNLSKSNEAVNFDFSWTYCSRSASIDLISATARSNMDSPRAIFLVTMSISFTLLLYSFISMNFNPELSSILIMVSLSFTNDIVARRKLWTMGSFRRK